MPELDWNLYRVLTTSATDKDFFEVQIVDDQLTRQRAMAREPKNPLHPGEILLEEFLEPMGMSQAAFVDKTGWTKARVNELIRGKRGVTAEAALDLAEVLGTSAKLWMNLQASYDLDRARNAAQLHSRF